ncbi:hypothetical protein BGZ63DRAFT_431735 [Mariannaea sp. PMI_226]|nr:hypothetical protein BGZ63DRAFT_431735 [Mariannaea sp. PMI_226]
MDPHVELPANGSSAIKKLLQLSKYRYPYSTYGFLTIHPNRLTAHYAKSDHTAIAAGSRLHTRFVLARPIFPILDCVRYSGRSDEDGNHASRRQGRESWDDSGYGSQWDDMLSHYGQKLAINEDKRRRTSKAPGGADIDDPWVTWTGWAEHFRDRDLAQITYLSRGPVSESVFKRLWDTVEKQRQRRFRRIIESFERTKRWLNSIDPKSPVGQPFKLKDHESSMDKYKKYGARYICYCFGAWERDRETAKALIFVPSARTGLGYGRRLEGPWLWQVRQHPFRNNNVGQGEVTVNWVGA